MEREQVRVIGKWLATTFINGNRNYAMDALTKHLPKALVPLTTVELLFALQDAEDGSTSGNATSIDFYFNLRAATENFDTGELSDEERKLLERYEDAAAMSDGDWPLP